MTEDIELQEIEYTPPMVEEILHSAGIEVQRIQTPIGEITLLRFHTPAKIYTVKLDDHGVEVLLSNLGIEKKTGPSLVIAQPGQVPGLRGG